MFNKMKIVTAIVVILVVFTAMQAISGSLFFSSLHAGQHNFTASNQLSHQQRELVLTVGDGTTKSRPVVCIWPSGVWTAVHTTSVLLSEMGCLAE